MKEGESVRYAQLCALLSFMLLIAVVCVGGLRSANESAGRPSAAATVSPQQEIAVFALDRNSVREAELEQLRAIAQDGAAGEEIRNSAQRRMMELLEWMELEATIADVLAARGYETPVVTVHSDSVNVVVRAETLTREEAGVILELTTRETGVTGGNVKIIPIN